ncbi:PepSY domain-containing protein [Roseovarius salis]|uniref:PepSY domain-containing protein n=1 Tax=Roseovarius salis TaxID=3376063 RepID=UPI0037C67B3C
MKTLKMSVTALAIAAGFAAAGAQASEDENSMTGDVPPRSEWMSVSALAQKLEKQGYTVHEIEAEHGVYDVEMTDAQGMRVEGYLDPVTGDPVRRGGDDD